MSRTLLYVAYPMRLDMGAANAIQTYNTVRELRRLVPGMRLVVPRWLRERSAFADLGALHLPRPAVNKASRIIPWAGWSYMERTLYTGMLVMLLMVWRFLGRGYRVLYVRDSVCVAWLSTFRWAHGSRVIYEVHDLEASHPSKASKWPNGFWARFLPWLDRTALQRADRLVSLTHTFKRWVLGRGLRKETEIAVIPDAFDPGLYFPAERHQARKELGLSPSAFIVGYAGLTFAYRRLDLLVEAFAEMAGEDDLLVLVGGRPHEVAELRELARGRGVEDRLVTPGQIGQGQTPRWLNAADVLVIPDTVTGMTASPLKLFEYMAVGKPIVCKDMPALREIVDGEAAVFFPEGSINGLADALRRLKSDPQLARRLGGEAYRRSDGYSYEARAQKIADVVNSLLT